MPGKLLAGLAGMCWMAACTTPGTIKVDDAGDARWDSTIHTQNTLDAVATADSSDCGWLGDLFDDAVKVGTKGDVNALKVADATNKQMAGIPCLPLSE